MDGNVSTPSGLDLVERFVNTLEIDEDRDDIATPESLRAWLRDQGLPSGAPSPDGVRRARAVREALRALMLAHNGHPVDPDAAATLNHAAARAPMKIVFARDGRAELAPAADGVDAALGQILAVVERAQAEGTWQRMKACGADGCRWAYYDRSRNRSRHWCSMETCGNRAKARAYRARTGD